MIVAAAPQCGILAAPQEDPARSPVPHDMNRYWPTFCLAVGGLVCLDWMAKMWLLSALLCTTCTPTEVTLTSASPPMLTMERISDAGVHYGDCTRIFLAVVLFPEPCGWDRATPNQTLASR
jgi:hypothetical protein